MIVEQGITILMSENGRPSGEALIVLESHGDIAKALNHDRQHMGSRYIEVMEISQQQYQDDMSRQPGSVSYNSTSSLHTLCFVLFMDACKYWFLLTHEDVQISH